MKKLCYLILLCLLLEGCALSRGVQKVTMREGTYKKMGKAIYYKDYDIHIVSDPSGIKIEWDNEYLGKTPLTYTYNETRPVWASPIIVRAFPLYEGQEEQVKILLGDKVIPESLHFDMTRKK